MGVSGGKEYWRRLIWFGIQFIAWDTTVPDFGIILSAGSDYWEILYQSLMNEYTGTILACECMVADMVIILMIGYLSYGFLVSLIGEGLSLDLTFGLEGDCDTTDNVVQLEVHWIIISIKYIVLNGYSLSFARLSIAVQSDSISEFEFQRGPGGVYTIACCNIRIFKKLWHQLDVVQYEIE